MTACVAMEAKCAKPLRGNAVAQQARSWSACLAFALLAGAVVAHPADERTPTDHLSPAAEQAMWQEIQGNLAVLRQLSLLPMPSSPTAVGYQFPLRLAPGLPDFAGHRVSAFADHNPTAGAVLDYNGGSRTYDGHRGTDLALTPFNWNKVDAGDMQAVAAAAGTIAGKSNVDATDHNPCDGGSNADPWNYVTVVHVDGTLTIYGHLRYNSLTGKSIGQTVAQGEYLRNRREFGQLERPASAFRGAVRFLLQRGVDRSLRRPEQPAAVVVAQPASLSRLGDQSPEHAFESAEHRKRLRADDHPSARQLQHAAERLLLRILPRLPGRIARATRHLSTRRQHLPVVAVHHRNRLRLVLDRLLAVQLPGRITARHLALRGDLQRRQPQHLLQR